MNPSWHLEQGRADLTRANIYPRACAQRPGPRLEAPTCDTNTHRKNSLIKIHMKILFLRNKKFYRIHKNHEVVEEDGPGMPRHSRTCCKTEVKAGAEGRLEMVKPEMK